MTTEVMLVGCYTYYDRRKRQKKIKVVIEGTTIKFDKVEQLTKF